MVHNFPLGGIILLLLTSFIIPFLKKKEWIYNTVMITYLLTAIMSFATLLYVNKVGTFAYMVGGWDAPWGIELRMNHMTSLVATIIISVGLIITWFSGKVLQQEIKESKIPLYYIATSLLLASLQGMIYSYDLFNIYVFIEISTLASCGIIVVKDKGENIKATIKYLILSLMGSGLVLMGIAFIYSITGHLNIGLISQELPAVLGEYPNIILVSMALFLGGLGVKGAMFPLHIWLPDAHSSAPSTSSAMLSGLVLKGYIVVMIKVVYQLYTVEVASAFPLMNILMILGGAGMVFGSLLAVFQKEIKRMLAYSSVAQMGYIFFGIGLASPMGLSAAIFHILNHAVTKTLLFLVVGVMIQKRKSKYIQDYRGLGIEMPYTMTLFGIGGLSMVGFPMLVGFMSKWYLSQGSLQADKPALVGLILLSSLLNAVYYLPIVINGFFGEENTRGKVLKAREEKFSTLLPLFILALGIVLFGSFPHYIMMIIQQFSNQVFSI